jgi:hypothetical protein
MNIATAFVELRAKSEQGKAEARDQARAMAQEATKTFAQFFSAAIVVREIGKAVQAASNLEQAIGGTAAVFGESQRIIDEFASDAAKNAGLSEAAFRTLTSQIGGLLNGLGFTRDESAKTSVSLAQLGADLAATFGGNPEEAVQALGAALRGEFEPLERFGVSLRVSQINLKAVEMGLATSTTAVSDNARAQAALAIIMEKTADSQGQFAREANTAAGKSAILAASFENARAKLGEQLLPIFVQAVDLLSFLVDGFSALPGPVQTALVALVALVALAGPMKTLVTTIKGLMLTLSTANPVLLALTAAVAAAGAIAVIFSGQTSAAAKAVDDMADSMKNATSAAEGLAAYLAGLADEHDSFARVLDAAGVTVDDVANAALAGGVAWDDMRAKLVTATAAIKVGGLEQAALNGAIAELPARAAEARTEAERYQRVIGTTADSTGDLADRTSDATVALEDVALEAIKTWSAFDELDAAAGRLKAAFDDLIGRNVDADEALDRVKQSAQDLNDSLFENSATLDANTDAGRRNRDALREQVTAIVDAGVAMVNTGASNEEAAAKVLEMRDALVAQLTQAGFTQEQVESYLDTLGLTPENVTTSIETAGVDAQRERINGWIEKLGEIPASQATAIQALIDDGKLDEAERKLANLARDREAILFVQTQLAAGNVLPGFGNARGGYYDRFVPHTSLVEDGDPEAVLPLRKPSRLAELLADERIRRPVVAALAGGASGGGGGAGGSSAGGGTTSVQVFVYGAEDEYVRRLTREIERVRKETA